MNFADGRGNVAVNLEYAAQDAFFASDSRYFANTNGFVLTHIAGDGTTTPNNLFFRDIRSATYSNGGLVRFTTGQSGQDYRGTKYRTTFLFQPDGTLIPQTGTRVGVGPNGSFIGGNGINFLEADQAGLQPQLERTRPTSSATSR